MTTPIQPNLMNWVKRVWQQMSHKEKGKDDAPQVAFNRGVAMLRSRKNINGEGQKPVVEQPTDSTDIKIY